MKVLTSSEVDQVSGSLMLFDIGYISGFVTALIGRAHQRINRMNDPMLGAMQFGA